LQPRAATLILDFGSCYKLSKPTRFPLTKKPTAMSELQAQFEQASKDVKNLPDKPDNDTLLKLYALYKQGTDGDVSGPKPGFFDFVAVAKYEAWDKLKGTSQTDAQTAYVKLVNRLK